MNRDFGGRKGSYSISLDNVSLGMAGRTVLDRITAEIEQHRVGIVGLNGSGKSTLARIVGGLEAPSSGTVRLNGSDPFRDRHAAIRTVGMVFQNPDHQIIFPTVIEEMSFGPINLGMAKADAQRSAQRLLKRFGKPGWGERLVHQLSQGQRHLVCLLAILIMEPELLVLDEPFTGPDRPTARRLHRLLDEVGQAVIMITHETELLSGYDRIIWLDRGRIRRDGPPGAVLDEFDREMERLGESDAVFDVSG